MERVEDILAPESKKFPADHLVYQFIDTVRQHTTEYEIKWRHYSYNSLRYRSYDIVTIKLDVNEVKILFGEHRGILHYNFPARNGVNSIIINGDIYRLYNNEFGKFDMLTHKFISYDDDVKGLLISTINSFKKTESN